MELLAVLVGDDGARGGAGVGGDLGGGGGGLVFGLGEGWTGAEED